MVEKDNVANPVIDVSAIAEQVRSELDGCRGNLASAVQHALRVGELLKQAKERVPHGEWGDWLKQKCALSERQAQKFVRLAVHRDEFDKDDPDWPVKLTINGALRRLRKLLEPTNDQDMPPQQAGMAKKPDDEEEQSAGDAAELKLYQQRCRRLKRFLPGGQPTKSDLPVVEAVDKVLEIFTREVVRLARKHGQSLCKKEELEGADGDFVAMVLFSKLDSEAAKYFAPQIP